MVFRILKKEIQDLDDYVLNILAYLGPTFRTWIWKIWRISGKLGA
jgi:hypothetical protein